MTCLSGFAISATNGMAMDWKSTLVRLIDRSLAVPNALHPSRSTSATHRIVQLIVQHSSGLTGRGAIPQLVQAPIRGRAASLFMRSPRETRAEKLTWLSTETNVLASSIAVWELVRMKAGYAAQGRAAVARKSSEEPFTGMQAVEVPTQQVILQSV